MITSKNNRAEKIMGLRDMKGVIPIDYPPELGYHCPICKYKHEIDGNYDERLTWSEYNGFLYCKVCNIDIPACLCVAKKNGIEKAIELFLDIVEDVIRRKKNE